jgi:RNA polymerase sigma-70 factor (ECF subfamily)
MQGFAKSASRFLRYARDTTYRPAQEKCGVIDHSWPGVEMKNFRSSIVASPDAMQAPGSQLSEKELVTLAALGDGEAFAVICRRYERKLFRIAARITGNVSDAEDIVQDALLNAYKGMDTFRFSSSLSTWLTRIVINCALMELRRTKHRAWLSLDAAHENCVSLIDLVYDPTADVEEELCSKEQSQLLTGCIAQLPASLRTIIEDYRTSEPTIAELAQSHAITVAAAKSRLLRAKTTIRNSTPVMNARRRTAPHRASSPRPPP